MVQCRAMTVKALRTAHGLHLAGKQSRMRDADVASCMYRETRSG